jgi:HD-GYP domain-containing protein (c-di-GMP phosphodiesterase class II)
MVTDRPYKAAVDSELACAELHRCAGTQFDPAVVPAFLAEVAATRDAGSAAEPAVA